MTDKFVGISCKIREIMIRSQTFRDYYILCQAGQPVDKKYICRTFDILRLATNRNNINHDLVASWNSFAPRYLQAKYDGQLFPDYAQCLLAAHIEMGTMYTSLVVERFASILKQYLFYSSVKDRAVSLALNDQRSAIGALFAQPSLIDIPKPTTKARLSSNPGVYIPVLRKIVRQYEKLYQVLQKARSQSQEFQEEDQQEALSHLFVLFPRSFLK
ncbi:hypothetical protein PHYBLDRAFT_61289 [Phycomyces blakesleeanus NRRL 1555(-)]|uniref:Uncharacterized protein n=1 Tax=Phycomyces blakesleeanus (strain ATCC 8743b / DSM 1359 / FGSC 10004 / NBRC 33097 / NRRL 1555) TaxID=763407 RepID=A0A162PW34_PHYB8|nr:hypothetical protein PHYBLDRAFT_61289 [Phycomyces blakesleeanus NRRL 1555(-)]OAD74656.1 hypothetical protein PHYBLDRAFT_61289 [Phycomyces blakesleeanus NRRL 1555(-)]|eukprot:XP_018292696.1 hypothetical protein PHYBLDRAFT_61289 [Phycomyces blakesleeanus NRRL 1555(-)]